MFWLILIDSLIHWFIDLLIEFELIKLPKFMYLDVADVGFLANRTARSMICCWHDSVVCLSVCLSVYDPVHCG